MDVAIERARDLLGLNVQWIVACVDTYMGKVASLHLLVCAFRLFNLPATGYFDGTGGPTGVYSSATGEKGKIMRMMLTSDYLEWNVCLADLVLGRKGTIKRFQYILKTFRGFVRKS